MLAAANGTGLEVASDQPPPAAVTKQMSISEAAKLHTFEHHTGMKVVSGEASNSSAASPAYAPEPAPEGNDDPATLFAGESIQGPGWSLNCSPTLLSCGSCLQLDIALLLGLENRGSGVGFAKMGCRRCRALGMHPNALVFLKGFKMHNE